MTRLVDFIEQQNAVDFKTNFNELMSNKVEIALEDEKLVVAQKFFGTEAVVEEAKETDTAEGEAAGGVSPKVSKKNKEAKKSGGGGAG